MKRIWPILSVVFAAAILTTTLGSCKSASRGPDTAEGNVKAYERTRQKINLLDMKLDSKIASDLGTDARSPDGRLLVSLSMRNKTSKNLHVQVRTVFKDPMGFSIGDESPWDEVYFSPRQAKTYRAQSKLTTASSYTVEVRLPVKVKGKGTS